MVIKSENQMIFKVNRPSYQTKSSFVENVLRMRDQINNWLCGNPQATGAHYERIVRNFMSANLREDEAEKIIKQVPTDYSKELGKIKSVRGDLYNAERDEDQAYFIAWDNAYKRSNAILDRYYRIKGNELRIGVISRYGFNPEGIEVEFQDAEIAATESQEIAAEAEKRGD